MGGPFKNALCGGRPGHPNYPNRGCIRRTGHEGPHRNAVHEWDSCAWMAPLWKRGDPTKWDLYDGERPPAASGDEKGGARV